MYANMHRISVWNHVISDFIVLLTATFTKQGEDVHGIPGLVNLFGIESPGLTASMAIAEHVTLMALHWSEVNAPYKVGFISHLMKCHHVRVQPQVIISITSFYNCIRRMEDELVPQHAAFCTDEGTTFVDFVDTELNSNLSDGSRSAVFYGFVWLSLCIWVEYDSWRVLVD